MNWFPLYFLLIIGNLKFQLNLDFSFSFPVFWSWIFIAILVVIVIGLKTELNWLCKQFNTVAGILLLLQGTHSVVDSGSRLLKTISISLFKGQVILHSWYYPSNILKATRKKKAKSKQSRVSKTLSTNWLFDQVNSYQRSWQEELPGKE